MVFLRGDNLGKTRVLGGLLCLVCAIAIILYIGFVITKLGLNIHFFEYAATTSWFIVLPVVVGVWVLAGLGLWLGWIMATTKEVSPPMPESEKEKKPAKTKKK
jgi:hypothetical protein